MSATAGEVSSEKSSGAARWMRWWLLGAGVYNLVWGATIVLVPRASLRALGVQPTGGDVWPQLWACIGMIIGVYGVGYVAASRDPLRHWPIVLVGLLGKVFGPIGFVTSAAKGELPWSMGWTILTNDLAWWIPFAMILRRAAIEGRAGRPARCPACGRRREDARA